MANLVPIKKEQHQHLKITAARNINYIANQHIVPITAFEYSRAATSFPIFFVKDPDSERMRSIAILGLSTGENLYFNDGNWNGLYAPQSVTMVPFSLGLDPEKEKTLTACVDLDSEFVGDDKELPLFNENGEESDLLKNVQESLGRLYDNEVMTDKFIKEMTEADLIEEIEILINYQNGEKRKLVGMLTIKEPKLRELSDEQVLDFHKRGLFIPIHAMLSSIGQLNRLAQLSNQSNDAKISGVEVVPVQK